MAMTLFAFLGIADVDEGLTQSLLEIIVHDGRGLADTDGVIVNSGSDANHSGVIPDAVWSCRTRLSTHPHSPGGRRHRCRGCPP